MTAPRRLRLQAVLAVLAPLIIVAVVVLMRPGGSVQPVESVESIEPVDLAATEPSFDSADALADASDLVIVGTVIAMGPGRSISDPTDPAAGIQTTVFEVTIDEIVRGEAVWLDQAATVTIEHETSLIDGTPITINGTKPPAIDDQAVFFLIAGDGGDFPHFAINTTAGRRPVNELDQLTRSPDQLTRSPDQLTRSPDQLTR